MKYQAQRGTEDVLPDQSPIWRHLENTWLDLTATYGYGEIRTPTFEDTQLFIRTAGETSDVVSKEMYTFTDRGDRSITLKPEGTAPAMRAVVEHNLCPAGTILRLSLITPIFRYGRPQKGRLREGHQLGLELVGSPLPTADAEVLEIVDRYLKAIGLGDHVISVNSIGRAECRNQFRNAILAHVASWLKDQTEEERAKVEKNPLRLLDTKDDKVKAVLEGLAPVTDFLEPDSRANFETLQQLLTEAEVNFKLAPEIVRGLDYYTEMVFEVESNLLGAQSSICGGGRYDGLIQDIGGSPTPSVGVGVGIERLILALEARNHSFAGKKLAAFIVSAGQPQLVRKIARDLRSAGISVMIDIEDRSLKSQMRQADKSGATFALVIGETEASAEAAQVKNLGTSEQISVPFQQLSQWLGQHV